MKLTVNKETALFLTRTFRAAGAPAQSGFRAASATEQPGLHAASASEQPDFQAVGASEHRGAAAASATHRTATAGIPSAYRAIFENAPRRDLEAPDPSPRKRWSKGLFDLSRFGIDLPEMPPLPLSVCVPRQDLRIASSSVKSTVYDGGLPPRAFIDLGGGLAMSSPELLFMELANQMTPIEHLAFGFELCGAFTRDASDPIGGPSTFGVTPVTSVEKIKRFVDASKHVKGRTAAQRTLRYLSDNAWSPTESIIAAAISLPLEDYGYGLGSCTLNPRVEAPANVARAAAKPSRMPDIMIGGTKVGINYDGAVHLDLGSIVNAASEVGRNPEQARPEAALNAAVRDVRAKVVDDIRRNRELAAAGLTVFPVVKEDLYERGGLDRVMMQVVDAVARQTNRDLSRVQEALQHGFAAKERQRALLSLLPGTGSDEIYDLSTTEAFISF